MSGENVTRRRLPHWYMPSAMHFVTFRLADTISAQVLQKLKLQKEQLLAARPRGIPAGLHRTRIHKLLFAEYEKHLDRNRAIHWLDDPGVAALIRRSLYYWHEKKYGLCAYCVMPNHVHVLLRPFELDPPSDADRDALDPGEQEDSKSPLSAIMHSLKSYTAHEANRLLKRSGQFWQHESYDHWIRDAEELERIVAYINANPVKAGLANRPHRFDWCSAHDRYLHDGDLSGWLPGIVG